MPVTMETLLHPTQVRKVVSEIRSPINRLTAFYGLGPDGTNTEQVAGKSFSWDQFNAVRTIATGRPAGTGPARITPQIVGNVAARAYRAFEAVPLLYERIYRNRPIGGPFPSGELDTNGVRYITAQQERLGQRFLNNREFMVSRMLRGSGFQIKIDGDTMVPVDSGGAISVTYNVPAGNIGTVNGIFAGNWQTAASAVPHDEVLALNAYSEQLSGLPIEHAWLNSVTWSKLLKTDQVKTLAGSSNQPFATYDRVSITGADGRQTTELTAMLRGIPWVTWHINDAVLNVNGSDSKIWPDNRVGFTPSPSSEWLAMVEGDELVRPNLGSESILTVNGFGAWTTPTMDPAGVELKAIDICLPALYIPTAIFYATVAA